MRAILAAALICTSASAFAADTPLSVTKRAIGEGGDMWDLVLTNRGDDINIRHVKLNRGRCHAGMDQPYPHPMHFGDRIAMRMFDCDPIEVSVETDQGTTTIDIPE